MCRAAVLGLLLLALPASAAGPVAVQVVKTADGNELRRDGKPYLIKGAGGDGPRDLLAKLGGNSLRTWGADKDLTPLLDDAHKHGLTVCVGLWLGHERHGFNYNDADQVAAQLAGARAAILKYKDHPAVLMWGVGNEMEGYGKGDDASVWSAVNNIAALAKKLDPNHPTMTVVAEVGGDRVKNLHRLCPDVDVIGINSYGGAATLPERYRKAGGTKPYVLTEFGPPGSWETKKNAFGAVPEPTSTEKAAFYRTAYEKAVLGSGGLCLGSYAFVWGHKQEATATWFGLLLPDGSRLGATDALSELWTGKPVPDRCPVITSLKLSGPDEAEPAAVVEAKLVASDPEGEPLKVTWYLQREAAAFGTGGDAEEVPPTFPEAIVEQSAAGAKVKLPKDGGVYRLFAYVRDGKGGAAVANVPLRVKGPVAVPESRKAALPLVVYDEAGREKPAYVPTGWMGNTKALKLDEASAEQPFAGKTCLRAEYGAADGWAGVVWQSPPDDWGEKPGGWDLTGAKRLVFRARGAKGGEKITFEFGLLGKDKPFPDSAKGKLDGFALTAEWKEYAIDLKGLDLKRIKTGFAFVVAGQGAPVTFYLDDVRFE
jgi:hypothetical protein